MNNFELAQKKYEVVKNKEPERENVKTCSKIRRITTDYCIIS